MNIPGLSKAWKVIITSLLDSIRKNCGPKKRQHCTPWILRSDAVGTSRRNDGMAASAITISFPFFMLAPLQDDTSLKSTEGYPMMPLFESQDHFGASREWDSEQMFSTMGDGNTTKDQFIHVPHIWAMIADNSKG